MKKWIVLAMMSLAVFTLAVPVMGADGQALKWQTRANGIFRSETEHFVVFVHVNPGVDKINDKAAAAAAKLEQFYNEANELLGSTLDQKIGVVFDAAKATERLTTAEYDRLFDGPAFYVWDGFMYRFERSAASIISQVMLILKLEVIPSDWQLLGFGEWFYSSYHNHQEWLPYRGGGAFISAFVNEIPIRVSNPLAGPSKWGRKPDSGTQTATSILDYDPHYASVFYFLEKTYGLDKLKSFFDAWGETRSFDRAIKNAYEADTKALEAQWRLFVLFKEVSDFEWVEGKKDYRTTVEGLTVALKKTKTLWYDKSLNTFILALSRAMNLSGQLTGFQPSKPPVLTIDAFAAKKGIKPGRDGVTVSYIPAEKDKLIVEFITTYTAQALAGLKLKNLPRWVEPGLVHYIASKSVDELETDEIRNSLAGSAVRDWAKLSPENDADTISALFEFMNIKYGNQAIARLITELGGGAAMDSAMQAVTGKAPETVKNEFVLFLALPSNSTLQWKQCPGGVSTEVGATTVVLKLDRRIMTLKPADETALQAISDIEGNLRALTGRNEKITLTFEAVEDESEPRLDGTNLHIPLTSAQQDSLDTIILDQMVHAWLTRATGGHSERIPAWFGEGLCGLIAARMDTGFESSYLREQLSSVKVDSEVWNAPWAPGSEPEEADLWRIAMEYLVEKYAGRIPAFLSALAEGNAEAAMTRAFAMNMEAFARQFEMYMQVEIVSELKWTLKGRTPLSVTYETRVGNVRVALGMAVGELAFRPGDDSIVNELDQWVARICKSLGMPEAGPVSVTLHYNSRSDLPVVSHQGLDVVALANGDIVWSTRQSIAFELGRTLVEEKWRRTAAGAALPVWLKDGIAAMFVYLVAEGTETMTLYGQESLPGFAEIIESYDPASLVTDEPTVLASVFSYLHRAHPGSIGRIIEQMAGGADFQLALLRATGRNAASLENSWKAEQSGTN